MSLYIQSGYGKGNKIIKAVNDNLVQGVIFSPRSEKKEGLEEYIKGFRNMRALDKFEVLFDPQYYFCCFPITINPGKLSGYKYYTENLSRGELSKPSTIKTDVEQVLQIEDDLEVDKYITPTIVIDDFNGRDCQIAISLAYESMQQVDKKKDFYISFCISENAFSNSRAMMDFLDTISMFDVFGFYIIIIRNDSNSHGDLFVNTDRFSNIIKFLFILSDINKFEVLVGYSDIISILLSIAGKIKFSCGWFNNLKIFKESSFTIRTGGSRPLKHYTSLPLLNSISLIPQITALQKIGKAEFILSGLSYDSYIYPKVEESEWTDEISCLHNWEVLGHLLRNIDNLDNVDQRIEYVQNMIRNSKKVFEQFHEIHILDNVARHYDNWNNTIELFKKNKGV